MKSKIAVILPSRGMSFSESMEELLRELDGKDYRIFFSIGNSLPDCFNIPIEEALKDDSFTHILVAEDDMILPRGILDEMLALDYPVSALDYPFRKDYESTVLHAPEGGAIYTGTGFLLIERWVLDKMPKPIFVTHTAWEMLIDRNNTLVIWPLDVSHRKTYGLHDVNFGITMWSNDMPIHVMKRTAGQRKLRALGKPHTNKGKHDIYVLTKVLRNNTATTSDRDKLQMYLDRLNQVTAVELRTDKPEYVEYVDGVATLKERHVKV